MSVLESLKQGYSQELSTSEQFSVSSFWWGTPKLYSSSLSIWYPRHKLQLRIGLFFGAASLAGAFSGLIAYGITFLSGTQGLLGWSWIFVSFIHQSTVSHSHFPCCTSKILEGIATVAVGLLAFFGVSISQIGLTWQFNTPSYSPGGFPCDCVILNPRRTRFHHFQEKWLAL